MRNCAQIPASMRRCACHNDSHPRVQTRSTSPSKESAIRELPRCSKTSCYNIRLSAPLQSPWTHPTALGLAHLLPGTSWWVFSSVGTSMSHYFGWKTDTFIISVKYALSAHSTTTHLTDTARNVSFRIQGKFLGHFLIILHHLEVNPGAFCILTKSSVGRQYPAIEWHEKLSWHGIDFHIARLQFQFPFWILDADGLYMPRSAQAR